MTDLDEKLCERLGLQSIVNYDNNNNLLAQNVNNSSVIE